MLELKRVYDPVSPGDGKRFLVERLWPRGLTRERLHLTAWLKEVGPSTELRRWFNHDPLKWPEFRTPDFEKLSETLKSKVIFDGRNVYELSVMKEQGYKYFSIGREVVHG